ncbi:Os08g0269300, partial [Oryza sativa Japonica Group]
VKDKFVHGPTYQSLFLCSSSTATRRFCRGARGALPRSITASSTASARHGGGRSTGTSCSWRRPWQGTPRATGRLSAPRPTAAAASRTAALCACTNERWRSGGDLRVYNCLPGDLRHLFRIARVQLEMAGANRPRLGQQGAFIECSSSSPISATAP